MQFVLLFANQNKILIKKKLHKTSEPEVEIHKSLDLTSHQESDINSPVSSSLFELIFLLFLPPLSSLLLCHH